MSNEPRDLRAQFAISPQLAPIVITALLILSQTCGESAADPPRHPPPPMLADRTAS